MRVELLLKASLSLWYSNKLQNTMKKIFVTGGSGFVGKALIQDLKEAHYEVYALARSASSEKIVSNLGAIPISGDLINTNTFASKLEGIDCIIHVAAMIEMWGKYKDFYKMNVEATENLVKMAIKHKVSKIVYISAASVVIDGKPAIDIDETYQISKDPHDNYSKTKALAEKKVSALSNQIQTIILRPPMIWGKAMPMIEEYRADIEKRGFPTIGDPNHTLSTCHVKNLNQAIINSIESSAQGIYYVTDGEKRPLRIFLKELAKGYGLDTGNKKISKGLALFMASLLEGTWKLFRLKGQPPITKSMVYLMGTEFSIDDSKARKELGYKNIISVEEGLKQLTHSPTEV